MIDRRMFSGVLLLDYDCDGYEISSVSQIATWKLAYSVGSSEVN